MNPFALLFSILLALFVQGAAADLLPEVVTHKDPNCGCCSAWAEHLEANGFKVKTVAERDMQAIKRRFAVPQRLTSCHTARVGGYVIEGHVPASAIKRLLRERPAVSGLAVPGMPLGSPGMEVPGKRDPYDVVSFDGAGGSRVFESHR
ncbi:MAG: metal-binding protein [Rhodocyclales bacterium]|nr:MAG: metal-binding protein [Rhodocyclales bacterium]